MMGLQQAVELLGLIDGSVSQGTRHAACCAQGATSCLGCLGSALVCVNSMQGGLGRSLNAGECCSRRSGHQFRPKDWGEEQIQEAPLGRNWAGKAQAGC